MRVASAAALEGRVTALRRLGGFFADGVPNPMFVCDPSGFVLLANAAAESWLGQSREDFVEKDLSELNLFDQATSQSWFSRTGDEGQGWTEDVQVRMGTGTSDVRVTLEPLRWGREKRFALAILVETDGRAAAHFPYRFSDGSRTVARYASTVAHDMRNPLTGISTGIQYLRRALKDDPDHLETLDMVLGEIQNLDDTIQGLTGLRSKFEIHASHCNLDAILGTALSAHRETTEKKRLTVSLDVEPVLPSFRGDPEHLTSAFSAVLERALNSSREDTSVSIRAAFRSVSPSPGDGFPGGACTVIRVSCTTDERDAREYVEAFDPSCPARDAQVGLYLAGQIIEAHGGALDISGTPGRSIHFAIALPHNPE